VSRVLIAAISATMLLLFLGPQFIAWLREHEVGQFVRGRGLIPDGHAKKQGTPTMGGLLILLAMAVPYLILSHRDTRSMAVFAATVGCGAIGFGDDFMKRVQRRSLGLAARWRMLALAFIAAGLTYVATQQVGVATTIRVPLVKQELELGWLGFGILVFLVLAGFANAVNLTDGLDGLAAGTSAIALVTYTAMTFVAGVAYRDLAILAACLVGSCVGFLWFNSFPAAVFMGDTGSYALGGALAAMAIMTKTEILLVIIGGVFVIETLSVIIQVVVFKRWRRRVFLMTPIHHHFEMAAWSETKIIVRFWLIAVLLGAIGFTLYFRSAQFLGLIGK
jgi:phospho-N-acetylmuramoyl-pentapeptide-transferase